jgi:alpha-amylase
MGEKVTFILGIHNHQPVGNFDSVIEDAYDRAYLPFLEVLYDFPEIPFALHNSGILWDWFGENKREYIEMIGEMVSRSQVEILSAGYYEPILSVIPDRDRRGQLSMMNRYIRNELNAEPRGCWLTERIWEPHLPGSLAETGIEFVIVDDAHFKLIGFDSSEMRTFFNSEDNGRYVKIFPIDEKLRYLIPFQDPEQTINYLREVAGETDNPVVVLADDGEKFGVWPGTHDLCYRRNWLRRFLEQLGSSGDWLEVSTFSRVVSERSPGGIVYLPSASYTEMMEWALPVPGQERRKKVVDFLESTEESGEFTDMIRGGFWRNFLVKYEESNWMHKRMLEVSELVEDFGSGSDYGEVWERAVRHLYQAQCNCAYWHGLFGGLYLPHLRSAIFRHLIEAEKIIENGNEGSGEYLKISSLDLDGDGVREILLRTPRIKLHFKSRGASIREMDIMDPPFNLTDILRRRREIYHDRVGSPADDGEEDTISIHQINRSKEEGLDKRIIYDSHQRMLMLDSFIPPDAGLHDFARSSCTELGDFSEGEFSHRVLDESGKDGVILFARDGNVRDGDRSRKVRMEKLFSVNRSAGLTATYSLTSVDSDLDCRLAVETCFSLLAGDAPDRYFILPGGERDKLASSGENAEAESVAIVDEWLGIRITIDISPAATLWRFPIETVSNSESGFESVYQGSIVAPVFSLNLKKGVEEKIEIGVTVERLTG